MISIPVELFITMWGTIIFAVIILVCRILGNNELKRKLYNSELEINENRINLLQIKYNNDILENIQNIIAETCTSSVNTFKDTYDLTKISKATVSNLIKDITNDIIKYIDFDNIDFSTMHVTRKYIDDYIINGVVICTKKLLYNEIELIHEDV